jgi:hypothetical protein
MSGSEVPGAFSRAGLCFFLGVVSMIAAGAGLVHPACLLAQTTWSNCRGPARNWGGNLATIRNDTDQHWATFTNFGAFLELPYAAAEVTPTPSTNPLQIFPYFSPRVGSQGFGAYYRFTDEPCLVEQARVALRTGSDVYKFLLGGDNYRSVYADLQELAPAKRDNLVHLIQNEPAFSTVFNLPFRFYVMWTSAMGVPYWYFGNGLPADIAQREYAQIYDLARYLLSTYNHSGKAFLLGHWEGDWVLLEGAGYNGTPRQSMIEGMTAWYRMRHQAVEDARNSMPDVQDVAVFDYAEVNLVQKAIEGQPALINAVLPYVIVDAVSYSAYDGCNYPDQLPQRLDRHLDFILGHAKFSGRWPYGKPVFIGEYGLGGLDSDSRGAGNLAALKAATSWGCPLVLFWAVYGVSSNAPSALVEPGGKLTHDYSQIQDYAAKAIVLRDSARVWRGRNPTETEVEYFSRNFDSLPNSHVIRLVLDGAGYAAQVDSSTFLQLLFRRTLRTSDFTSPLFTNLLTQLDQVGSSRFQTMLAILDSPEFVAAVGENEFARYLGRLEPGQKMPSNGPGMSRSARFKAALDSGVYLHRGLQLRDATAATPEILARCLPDFADTPVEFLDARIGMDGFPRLTIGAQTGRDIQVEISADLREWSLLVTVPNPTGIVQVAGLGLIDVTPQFYRAVQR